MNIKLGIMLLPLVIFSACKKDSNNEQSVKQLLLSKVSIENNDRLTVNIEYNKEKVSDVREILRDSNVTRFSDFAFDASGRIVAFKTSNSVQQNIVQETRLSFVDNNLLGIKITLNRNGSESVVNSFFLDKDDNTITSLVKDRDDRNIRRTTAAYNAQGNIVTLISRSLITNTADTTEFSNYDNNPAGLQFIRFLKADNDFLPASKNNPGKIVFKRNNIPTQEQLFTYKYNQQGLPIKIIDDRQTILLAYKEIE
jgi:hypothetical protein